MPKETGLSIDQILEFFNVSQDEWQELKQLYAEGENLPEKYWFFYKLILKSLLEAEEGDTFSLSFINEMQVNRSKIDINTPIALELVDDLVGKYLYSNMLPRNVMTALAKSRKPFVIKFENGEVVIDAEGLALITMKELQAIDGIGQSSIENLLEVLETRAQLPIDAKEFPSETLLSIEEIEGLNGRHLTKDKIDGTTFRPKLIAKLRNTVPRSFYSISYEVKKEGQERFSAHFLASQTINWYQSHHFSRGQIAEIRDYLFALLNTNKRDVQS